MSESMISVLAIDDDPTVLEMYRRAAAKAGFADVMCVDSPVEAFAALASRRFDLIFLDLNFPERSGPTLASGIISSGRGAAVTIVSSDDSTETFVECIERGARDYVTKPATIERLITSMDHVRSGGLLPSRPLVSDQAR